jgi:transposase-like protein
MGKQQPSSWEFKVQMVHLLAKGTQTRSQISRDDHVTRSLLSAWRRLSQQRGEAAFVPDRATASPPDIERPQHAEEQVAHLERLCGEPALELDVLRSEVDVFKKAWREAPVRTVTRADRAAAGADANRVGAQGVCFAHHNRQGYDQHRRPSSSTDRDQPLCQVRHLLRADFAG